MSSIEAMVMGQPRAAAAKQSRRYAYSVNLERIEIEDRYRKTDRKTIDSLKESFRSCGLINPITLQIKDEGKHPSHTTYRLVSGFHRLAAWKELFQEDYDAGIPPNEWQFGASISAIVFAKNVRPSTIRAIEIYENSARTSFTALESAKMLADLLALQAKENKAKKKAAPAAAPAAEPVAEPVAEPSAAPAAEPAASSKSEQIVQKDSHSSPGHVNNIDQNDQKVDGRAKPSALHDANTPSAFRQACEMSGIPFKTARLQFAKFAKATDLKVTPNATTTMASSTIPDDRLDEVMKLWQDWLAEQERLKAEAAEKRKLATKKAKKEIEREVKAAEKTTNVELAAEKRAELSESDRVESELRVERMIQDLSRLASSVKKVKPEEVNKILDGVTLSRLRELVSDLDGWVKTV